MISFLIELCSKQSIKVILLFMCAQYGAHPVPSTGVVCLQRCLIYKVQIFHCPSRLRTSVDDATVNEYITLSSHCQVLFLIFLRFFDCQHFFPFFSDFFPFPLFASCRRHSLCLIYYICRFHNLQKKPDGFSSPTGNSV